MTLSQIVLFVCGKIGLTDTDSQTLCASFAQRRYQMIYDKEDWADAMDIFSVSTVAATDVYTLPTGIERIKSLYRSTGVIIEPVDFTFILESYPELLTGTGNPRFYEEQTTGTTRQLKLYPIPVQAETLTLYGKKTFVELGDSDTPILRNIDNSLIAFTYFDMLQRMRQFDKAQLIAQEAAAALQLMTDVEKARANRPRMTRNTTVAGDSLEEMTDAVSCRIGDYSPETRLVIHELMRRNYGIVYDSQLWPESHAIIKLDRDGSELVLPEYVDKIIEVRATDGGRAVQVIDGSLAFEVAPQVFEAVGAAVSFQRLAPVGVAVLPPINEPLEFVSDDDSDTEIKVSITGESKGVEVRESITLNGMSPVLTGFPYDTPLVVAKGLTKGNVTVVGQQSRVFLLQLGPEERERKHPRIWFLPTPATSDTSQCLALCKRKIRPLVNDEDTPIFSGMANLLIQMTFADMLMKAGNDKGAKDARALATVSLQAMTDREIKQGAFAQRVVPNAEALPYSNCYPSSYFPLS